MSDPPRISDVRYEDLEPGVRFGPYAERLERSASDRLRGAVGETKPGELAPAGVVPLLFLKTLRRALGGIPPGGILARQRFEFHRPLPSECTVETEAWVGEQYERRGRFYTVFEFSVRLPGAEPAATGTMVIAAPP